MILWFFNFSLVGFFTNRGNYIDVLKKLSNLSNSNFNKTSYKDSFLKCDGILFQTFKNQVSRLISGFCNSDLKNNYVILIDILYSVTKKILTIKNWMINWLVHLNWVVWISVLYTYKKVCSIYFVEYFTRGIFYIL